MPNMDSSLTLEPIPSILIESLRDIGYSFETALADIIDNSLTAHATKVEICARTSPHPIVAVVDNGDGLSREDLLSSMRLGSKDPRTTREKSDLGRYGLGMKTASFSQCRKLTVASVRDGSLSAFIWDLDEVVRQNAWQIEEPSDPSLIPFVDMLEGKGTVVVWEQLDRICDQNVSQKQLEIAFNRHVSNAANHLGLVFHRFLSHEKGYGQIKILLNDTPIGPIDPFVKSHPATIAAPPEPISGGVTIQAFTLPHSSKYADKAEYEKNGLEGGYIRNQGIYLYRAGRLIIHGTWLGLAKKTPLTQLCRVMIDIDNSHDEDWKIDVKKASAQLPENVRGEVRNLLHTFNSPSKRVYERRGKLQVDMELHPVWQSTKDGNVVRYRINTSNPAIASFRCSLPDDERQNFDLVLKLIGAELPVDSLYVELSRGREEVSNQALENDELCQIAKNFFVKLKSEGQDEQRIIDVMRATNLFNSRWEEVLSFLGIEEH